MRGALERNPTSYVNDYEDRLFVMPAKLLCCRSFVPAVCTAVVPVFFVLNVCTVRTYVYSVQSNNRQFVLTVLQLSVHNSMCCLFTVHSEKDGARFLLSHLLVESDHMVSMGGGVGARGRCCQEWHGLCLRPPPSTPS